MTRKFGIGIVGAGMAVKPHMLALQDLARRGIVDVRGVHTRDPAKRAAFVAESGFPSIDSFDAMLGDPALDAIILMTPANAREELVAAAANAGKHILMEKPVERTTEAASRIVACCEAAGVKLGIVFQHRFRVGSLAMKQLVADGSLGDMATVYLVVPWWRPQSYYEEPGRGTFARDGGGVLISQAIHSMDLMLSLTGPVTEVQAIAGTSSMHRMETEDFVAGGLRFANGAMGSIMATVTVYPGETEHMIFNCANATAKLSGGVLDVNWHDGRRERFGEDVRTGTGGDPMDFPYDWHMAQIEEFIDAVRSDRQPVSNGQTALRVHHLIDALLLSSAEGRRVTVAASGPGAGIPAPDPQWTAW